MRHHSRDRVEWKCDHWNHKIMDKIRMNCVRLTRIIDKSFVHSHGVCISQSQIVQNRIDTNKSHLMHIGNWLNRMGNNGSGCSQALKKMYMNLVNENHGKSTWTKNRTRVRLCNGCLTVIGAKKNCPSRLGYLRYMCMFLNMETNISAFAIKIVIYWPN